MLFTNSSTGADTANIGKTDNIYYWLGSLYVGTYAGDVDFGIHRVDNGNVSSNNLCYSSGTANAPYYGVRPVVNLNSKVSLKDSGTMKDGCKLYNMNLTSGHN